MASVRPAFVVFLSEDKKVENDIMPATTKPVHSAEQYITHDKNWGVSAGCQEKKIRYDDSYHFKRPCCFWNSSCSHVLHVLHVLSLDAQKNSNSATIFSMDDVGLRTED
jgi:hypothetical protein